MIDTYGPMTLLQLFTYVQQTSYRKWFFLNDTNTISDWNGEHLQYCTLSIARYNAGVANIYLYGMLSSGTNAPMGYLLTYVNGTIFKSKIKYTFEQEYVVGDGIKTYSQILDELYNKINTYKVSENSVIIFLGGYLTIAANTLSDIYYSQPVCGYDNITIATAHLCASGSKYYVGNPAGVTDLSSTVFNNKAVMYLRY